jgi:hypothetical protein
MRKSLSQVCRELIFNRLVATSHLVGEVVVIEFSKMGLKEALCAALHIFFTAASIGERLGFFCHREYTLSYQ